MSYNPIDRPASSEYGTSYYTDYINRVPEGDLYEILEDQRKEVARVLNWVTKEDWGTFRYEPGKWSVNDIIGHINDAERIFSYRALRIARGDKTPLPGWEQDDYVFVAGADSRETDELAQEFDLVRQSTLVLLRSLEPEAFMREGTANDKKVTVRALAYIIAGHTLHHLDILRERYRIKA